MGPESHAAYYNECDAPTVAWLRALIAEGLIPAGEVDDRSIADVRPADLVGYTQCHFFAGIGGWPYALRLAGWPDDRHGWTGSCPCQPFSGAGKALGHADARHLWPEFFRLIAECRPATVFGEQVASALGRNWLTAVRLDLETLGYAVGGTDQCAAGVGAPHIRQRLWWVADAERRTPERRGHDVGGPAGEPETEARQWERVRDGAGASSPTRGLADHQGHGRRERRAVAPGRGEGIEAQGAGLRPANDSDGGGPGDSDRSGLSEQRRSVAVPPEHSAAELRGYTRDFWSSVDWLPCRDGKYRPTQPGLFPLADGIPARVVRLRGYGNAINVYTAAAFVTAYLETGP